MSSYYNSTTSSDIWSGYISQAQFSPTPRMALLALVNIPLIAIALNVLWQLVSPFKPLT